MLLYMAIMQIFGGANNEYAFKQKLWPFLVGILIVPFTWLIVSWTLSFANQAVAAVLSIPMNSIGKLSTGTLPGTQNKSLWHAKVLPKQFDFTTNSSGYGEDVKCTGGKTKTGVKCISPAEFLTHNEAGPFFIIMIYAYNIFKIQEADMKPLKNFCKSTDGTQYMAAKDCTKNLMGIVRDFWLSLIVTVFFAIMLIALCWVLLMRAIKLWIYIMLSPLFGLAFFTWEWLGTPVWEGWESGMGSVGFKAFFKLAMVPVLVSAVLAFGLLFVWVVRDNFHSSIKQATVEQTKLYCTNDSVWFMVTYCITETPSSEGGATYWSRLIIGTDIRWNVKTTSVNSDDALIILNFWDTFSKIISGAAGASVATWAGIAAGTIGSVDDIFAHLILTMLALVFMFMGVQVAVKFDAVTEAAFRPFAKLWESVWNFVVHSPSYIPLPHPAFAALTPDGIAGITAKMNQSQYNHQQKMARTAGDMFDGPLNKAKGDLKDVTRSISETNETLKSVKDRMSDYPENAANALRNVYSKSTAPEAKQMSELVEKNQGSLVKLQWMLQKNEEINKKAIAGLKPADQAPANEIMGTITSSTGSPAQNTTPRKINISGLEWTMTGSTLKTDSGWLTITLPELWPNMPVQTNKEDQGYKRLQSALLSSGGEINKENAEKIYWHTLTDDQIRYLKRHYQR